MEKTSEEKLDYIYETLKKQESRIFRQGVYKWLFRLFILAYMFYAYYYILPGIFSNLKELLSPKISVDSINLDSVKDLFTK